MHIVPVPSFTVTDDPTEDRLITREEALALRHWMLRDEPPVHDEVYAPSDADARWWANLSRALEPLDFDAWMDDDHEATVPELSDDANGFFGFSSMEGGGSW